MKDQRMARQWKYIAILLAALTVSCGARNRKFTFQVVARNPSYVLRSPDLVEAAFAETLTSFSNMREGWVDLQPGMALKAERAYFKEGSANRRIENYVGVETAHFRMDANGTLRPAGLQLLPNRPADQPPVNEALPISRLRHRYHRFYFQVAADKASGSSSAVLLSAGSPGEIAQLSNQIELNAAAACRQNRENCTVFPEGCSASLYFNIVFDGEPRAMLWGSTLGGVVGTSRSFRMLRPYRGRPAPVILDPNDPETLRLPLLPNDIVELRGAN
jgi:hypothetical protein